MRKLITAIILCCAIYALGQQNESEPKPLPKPKHPRIENRKANPQREKAEPDKPVESPDGAGNGSPIEQHTSETKGAKTQESPPDHLYRVYLWATIIGVGIGLFGLGFIYRQIKIAEKTADALMNIERPWLLIVKVQYSPGGTKEPSKCYFNLRNYGKTPAWIVEVGGTFRVIQDLSELSKDPQYGKCNFATYGPIPPDEESETITIPLDVSLPTPEQQHRMMLGELSLIGFGFVKYQDPFKRKKPYETRFCYCFPGQNPYFFERCGPACYHETT